MKKANTTLGKSRGLTLRWGILLVAMLGFPCRAEEPARKTGVLQSADGSPVADAPFHVFTYSRKASDCVELASGKTGKNGEFSYPVEQSDVEKFSPPFFFAEIPGNGHFAANLQINKAEPVVLKAWGPWADLVVTFTTPDGKPASGLHGRVTQVYDTTDEFLLDVPRLPTGTWDATTDSNGQLILHGLPVHYRFYLEMDDARYAQLMGHNSTPQWLAAGRPQSVKLIPAGSISGQVTFPDGTPVRDVPVEVLEQYHYEDAGGGSGKTRTDAEGRFTIGGLRPATYDVMARLTPKQAEEWAAAVRPGVRLRLAENAANQDIRLTKGVLVTGKITNSETGKLIADQALTIGLVPADETSPLGQLWAETSEGRYRTRIPAVPHRVYFASSAKGFERGEEEPTRVNARDGEEVTVDFALKPKGKPFQVTGRVIGTDGKPAAGAAVHVFLTNGYESSSDTVDSTGNFSIEIPRNIKEAIPIFATDGPRRSPIQKVAVGKPITLQLGDKDLTSIRGCVVDEQGKPIPGATVHFQLADDAVDWQHALSTDATGRFELADIWSDVAFNVYGEAEGFGYAHKKVTTTRGKKLDLGNLVLKKADRVLEGVVVDPDGKPASVLLSVSGGSDQPMVSAKSDSEGHFLVSGLLEGKIFLRARQKFGERYVDVARAKAEAGDRQIKLTIKRADATLHGRLVNSAKQPIAGAMVVTNDHDQPGDISAITAKDGTFRLPGVFPGWLTVKVMPDRHSKTAIALRGKAGSEESLLVLPAPPIAATANPPTPPARLVGVGDPAPAAEVAVWLTSAPLPPQNQGTVRILDFWNIFCGPCIANLPRQQEFWEAHRREGLEMIALHPAWNEQEIREFLAARPNVRFPIAIEKEGCPTSNRYPIEGVPTYVVIDPDGKIEFIGAGDWEGAKAKALSLLAALAKQKAESP